MDGPWLHNPRTQKRPHKQCENYRPITCLPTYYKLLTMIYIDLVYDHVMDNGILPLEQKGVKRKARGCKDHLLLDKALMEDAKKRQSSLSMMWIDYKKVYDSVPHSWILECLWIYKIDDNIIQFIEHTLTYWKTRVSLHHANGCTTPDTITFLKGIFQGDTLSPLIFCLALAPICNILKRKDMGYKINETKVSNVFYINDLKVYAKDATQMEQCRALVKEFSDDIKMSFGIEKCAVIHLKRGNVNNSPEVEGIPILNTEESYKYLGILESDSMKHKEAISSARKEFFKRVRGILKQGINAKSIRTFAMPILCYGFRILKWTSADLKGIHRKVRKMLTKHGFHHPKSNTHWLYLSREEGGRGLIGAEDCHRKECSALAQYLSRNNDPLSQIIKNADRPKAFGLLSYIGTPKEATTRSINDEHEEKLLKMDLHGNYFKNRNTIPTFNQTKSSRWLNAPFLRYETESLLCAAQEQALATNYLRCKTWGSSTSSMCRLCKEQSETVHHIVSGCKMLCGTQYLHRHNQVAKYIHWNILCDNDIDTTESWLDHKPLEITTKGKLTILWDSYIQTDKR